MRTFATMENPITLEAAAHSPISEILAYIQWQNSLAAEILKQSQLVASITKGEGTASDTFGANKDSLHAARAKLLEVVQVQSTMATDAIKKNIIDNAYSSIRKAEQELLKLVLIQNSAAARVLNQSLIDDVNSKAKDATNPSSSQKLHFRMLNHILFQNSLASELLYKFKAEGEEDAPPPLGTNEQILLHEGGFVLNSQAGIAGEEDLVQPPLGTNEQTLLHYGGFVLESQAGMGLHTPSQMLGQVSTSFNNVGVPITDHLGMGMNYGGVESSGLPSFASDELPPLDTNQTQLPAPSPLRARKSRSLDTFGVPFTDVGRFGMSTINYGGVGYQLSASDPVLVPFAYLGYPSLM